MSLHLFFPPHYFCKEYCSSFVVTRWHRWNSHPSRLPATRKDAAGKFLPVVCFSYEYSNLTDLKTALRPALT